MAANKATQEDTSTSPELVTEAKDKVNTEPNAVQNTKKQPKVRHRASVACASCRDRRIRCVVPPGEIECTQCKRSGVECIIKNDDERRRPISRAYMCSLTERINILESMLRENGAELPPAQHPPMTRHGARGEDSSPARKYNSKSQGSQNTSMTNGMSIDNGHSSPGSQNDDMVFEREGSSSHRGDDGDSAHSAPSPSMIPPPKNDGMISRLLSTRGHLSFDQLSGRLRYFGPSTNLHVHSEFGVSGVETQESFEQTRRADKIIRQLPMESYEYLMSLFWKHYNSYMHVLHQETFLEERENGRTKFYSPFLHICVLAMGFRFADRSRPDMQRITVAPRESSLHREAKYMLEFELERPSGIPSVVALLLLGDLECGVGRDNVGWLYGGMAVRIAFEIGLHLDTGSSCLPQREVEIRRMTLWACVIYDKYWALFLGRPTSMKSSDLEVYHLAKQFERLGTIKPAGEEGALLTRIYEALIDLMELAGKITENMDSRSISDSLTIDRDAYLRMAALDKEFGSWYSRLPEGLRWTPENIRTAPLAFFLLHQQYHAALILLHRPFALYEDSSMGDEDNSHNNDNHFSALSRAVCTKQAICVAKVFWHHRQRFDSKEIPITGLQHAGTAATALVAALAFLKDGNDRNNNMSYLECLAAALQDMSYTYQPAERMHLVLQAVLAELRGTSYPHHSNTSTDFTFRTPYSNPFRAGLVPRRRDSSNIDDNMTESSFPSFMPSSKRRALGRPSSMSSSGGMDLHIDPMLASLGGSTSSSVAAVAAVAAAARRKHSNTSDAERPESFVLVTPRSEFGSWPTTLGTDGGSIAPNTLTSNNNNNTNSSSSNTNNGSTVGTSSATGHWMLGGTGDLDTQDVSHLATVHFPELRDMATIGENGSPAAVPNLDFLSFGSGEEWRDWGTASDAMGDGGHGFGTGMPGTPGSVRLTGF